MSVSAKELLKEISSHDQSVIDVLSERPEGFTIVQIADKLKRPRKDVKYSIHNLKIGGHVKNYPYYGRVCLVNFDFKKQIIEKRPHEYVEKLEQRIADLERQLKAEREINDRLRVVETERAVRNDELYEALLDISHHGVMGGNSMLRIARETLEKHRDEYGERPLRYIAVHPNGTTSGFHHETKEEVEKLYKPSMSDWEIIPIRVNGDCDGN